MSSKAYGIYPHAEKGQPTGRGFVVRSGVLKDYPTESGLMKREHRFTASDTFNYPNQPMRVYLREADAKRYADPLNA